MLEFFNGLVDFIASSEGVFAPIVCISVTIAHAVIFLIELTLGIFSKRRRDNGYFLCFSGLCLIVSAYFSVEDYTAYKTVFSSPKEVYAFISALSCLSLLWFIALKLTNGLKGENSRKKPVKTVIKDIKIPIKTESFSTDALLDGNGELSGYLSVPHVKTIINELKTKPLDETDSKELEDLEVYLLNFVTRQPSPSERKVLAGQISGLIKKMSRYA